MLPINVVVEMLNKALDFTNSVVSKFDDEKYAKAVIEIYGYAPDYSELDTLAKAIENANDISTAEKTKLILAIADKRSALREKEIEYKKECAKIINKGFEKKCKFTMKLALGIATGGVSLLPDVYHLIVKDKDELTIEPKSEKDD